MNRAIKDAYDCYHDEVKQCEEEYEEGLISEKQYNIYLTNLANNLQGELDDIKRGE